MLLLEAIGGTVHLVSAVRVSTHEIEVAREDADIAVTHQPLPRVEIGDSVRLQDGVDVVQRTAWSEHEATLLEMFFHLSDETCSSCFFLGVRATARWAQWFAALGAADERATAEACIQSQADGGAGKAPAGAYQSVGSTPLTAAPGCTTTSTSVWLGQLAAKPHSTNCEYPPRSAA